MSLQWSGLQHSPPSMGMGLLPFSLKPGLFHQVKVTELWSVRAQCRKQSAVIPEISLWALCWGLFQKLPFDNCRQVSVIQDGESDVGMCSVVWEGEHLIPHPYVYLHALSFTFLRIVWESKDSLSLPIPTVPCLMHFIMWSTLSCHLLPIIRVNFLHREKRDNNLHQRT